MIKALIFDFGRVISAQKPASLFQRYEDELGIARDSINPIMFDSEAWQKLLVGQIAFEEYWRVTGPRLGLNTLREARDFHRRYLADERIDPGVKQLLQKLHGKYKMAVLSNAPPGLDQWLRRWRIRGLFDVVFCSADEGLAKPDPAAFRVVLERLSVKAHEAIFIDDTPENVYAAQELGLEGIVFSTAEDLTSELNRLGVM